MDNVRKFPTKYYVQTGSHGHTNTERESWRMEEFERACCIRGYHVYKEVWEAALGEELACEREPHNVHDRYSVAVKRRGIIIGHLPRKLSRLCSLFLRRGGAIFCTVTGGRRYSGDLPQGGLEVPCTLLFKHKPKEVHKIKKLLSKEADTLYV